MSLYRKIAKADQTNKEGGYKNVVLFAPKDDFLSIAKPTINLDKLGGPVVITTAHTFGTDNGFFNWLCKKHSVTTKATSTGEDGSKSLTHTAEFILLGDSSTTLDQMRKVLNDDIIFLLKDQDCLNATDYVQFGDECVSPDISIEFDGKTTKEGLKEYKVSISVKDKKFFYQGAIVEATNFALNQVVNLVVTGNAATSIAISYDAVPGATSYSSERSSSPSFTSPLSGSNSGLTSTFTTLTTNTLYYFRVRATNAAGVGPWSNTLGVRTA